MESLYKSVAIIGKYASGSESSDIESQLLELAQYLTNKHINIFIEAKTHQSGKFQAFKAINLEEIGEKADLAIVVGGDGTMLGVARSLVNFDIPLIGINQGRFGFLADLIQVICLNLSMKYFKVLLIKTKECCCSPKFLEAQNVSMNH
jgi:Predicted sugar kinase